MRENHRSRSSGRGNKEWSKYVALTETNWEGKKSDKTANVRITQYWCAFVKPRLAWKSIKYYILCACVRVDARAQACACACSLTNLACNVQPYCHQWPPWLHHIFPHYLVKSLIFGKLIEQHLFETFLILIQRDIVRNVKSLHVKHNYSFRILIKLEFSQQTFEKT
jgi:hypothetical protein